MFPKSALVSETGTLLYDSPGENHLTTSPTRVFPDLQKIIDNNTNADTGACPSIQIAPPVPPVVKECFLEFLPTLDYVGFAGVNASPLSLHFRFTARDTRGGVNSGDTTLLLATNAGPFRVTSPDSGGSVPSGSTMTVTWDKANTDIAPVSTANVKISLSIDGGHTFPYVLAASTPNDGSEVVTIPSVVTTHARVKVEAVDNIFFDISNSDFSINALPVVTNDACCGGIVQGLVGLPLSPVVTVTATDADSFGSQLTRVVVGLPAGMSLPLGTTSPDGTLPGVRTWVTSGAITAAPGIYPVTVTVTDNTGGQGTTSFTIVVSNWIGGPAAGKVWLGLKNSDDVGTNFDLKAEVLKNGSVIGTGETDNVSGGSSGFNNAVLRTIDIALGPSPVLITAGDTLSIKLYVRITALGGHRSGTARLWFNDAQANSRLELTYNASPTSYFLRDLFVLGDAPAPVTSTSKKTIDVFCDRLVGGNPFKVFGTWTRTF